MLKMRCLPAARNAVFAAAILNLAACSQRTPGPYTRFEGQRPDGRVEMHEVQAAYIGSAGGGSGTLFYRGRSYPFTIAGLGVGGVGASTIDATGDVYDLPNVNLFPGRLCPGPLRFRHRQHERRRSLASERERRRHASQGPAGRPDAESRRWTPWSSACNSQALRQDPRVSGWSSEWDRT